MVYRWYLFVAVSISEDGACFNSLDSDPSLGVGVGCFIWLASLEGEGVCLVGLPLGLCAGVCGIKGSVSDISERSGGNLIRHEVSRDLTEPSASEVICKFSSLLVALESPDLSSSVVSKG